MTSSALQIDDTAGRGFDLNAEQREAVEKLHRFLEDPDEQYFGVYGYAGTGKTTTIHEALKGFDGKVAMSAPTHKAVGVLAGMDLPNSEVDFHTIHRLLGCRKQYKNGEIFFAPDTSQRQAIKDYDVVVIDECSMIGERMWGWVEEAVKFEGVDVIVMGDPMQLPPVQDGEASPTFDLPCAELTEIMRHEGVIEQAATAMRKADTSDDRLPLAEDASDAHGEVVNIGQSEFLEALIGDLQFAKVLAYTNDAVDWVNDYIRVELFGEDARPFEPGERLVIVETYDADDTAMLYTETEIRVDTAKPAKHLGLECWALEVTDDEGGRHEIHALADNQKGAFFKKLGQAKDRGKAGGGWSQYYDLKEGFAQVRPGWATTIHKSQGSTYEHVYLIQTNVLSMAGHNRELAKMLLYVGYSRARSKLILS